MSILSENLSLVGNTGLLACKSCKTSILPIGIDRHFGRNPHSLGLKDQSRLTSEVKNTPNLIRDRAGVENLEISPVLPFFYPELALFRDGFQSHYCFYITRNRVTIQDHYISEHGWENPREKGWPSKSTKNVPWKTKIPCQQFFSFRGNIGIKYFLINPNNPWKAGTIRST